MRLRRNGGRRHELVSFVGIGLAALICACDNSTRDTAIIADSSPEPTGRPVIQVDCYRAPQSVLLGPPTDRRNAGHAPGWIRLERIGRAVNGIAELIDGNGAGLNGRWYHHADDSLSVIGADDFLRTELRVVVSADSLRGRGDAHSDADLERDSAGTLGDLRRTWSVDAVRVPCDRMPRRSTSVNR